MLSPARRILKCFHPEGIPWPGAVLYDMVSKTAVFQYGYRLLAADILLCCPEGEILDVGTGPGRLLPELARLNPRLRLTGLDISRAMVSVARENMAQAGFGETISIVEAAANHVPFPDGRFDAVVSTGSMHHWKDPVGALNEIHRVLKHGGYALIYDLAADTPEAVLKDVSRRFGRLRTMLLWLHTFEEPFYGSRELEELAASSLFGRGRTRFAGMLCCLMMVKRSVLPR
ncbi:MAG TPA: class I SAM-dependent methyltransferase [Syntrophobacter fumaroxidans]|nr:class I SAM-dependent methyltransferase [Syntrophobacter fumaroxidans]